MNLIDRDKVLEILNDGGYVINVGATKNLDIVVDGVRLFRKQVAKKITELPIESRSIKVKGTKNLIDRDNLDNFLHRMDYDNVIKYHGDYGHGCHETIKTILEFVEKMPLETPQEDKDLPDKPKEKVRVWTCVNCTKDLYFDYELGYYKHRHSSDYSCVENAMISTHAIPKPGSERWVEK